MLSSVTVSRNIHRRWPIRAIASLGAILMAYVAVGWCAGDDRPASATPSGILEATQFPGSLIGLQYESWFTPHNAGDYATA